MMNIEEGRIRFSFDDAVWSDLIKFDAADNMDYRKIERLNGTKSVDIFGSHPSKGYCFIEIKDFRGSRLANLERVSSDELFIEVGQKVKDSLACILAGARNSTHKSDDWKRAVKGITDANKAVQVVLWAEEDSHYFWGSTDISNKRRKVRKNAKLNLFKTKLCWLTARVHILSSQDFPSQDWDFGVAFL